MREIKFRAWVAKKKRFEYWEYGSGSISAVMLNRVGYDYPEQYTGLKDKHTQTEACEGDLVRIWPSEYCWDDDIDLEEEEIGEIVWYQKAGRWAIKIRGINYWPKEEDFFDFEVIGNIHENPELLSRADQ